MSLFNSSIQRSGIDSTFAAAAQFRRRRQPAERQRLIQEQQQDRINRLAGAAQSALSPTLSAQQQTLTNNVSRFAAGQGLFGGAVNSAQQLTQTQFLAGNRAAGLQTLAEDFINVAPGGRQSRAQATNEFGSTIATEVLGLLNQFRFGGTGGQQQLLNTDLTQVGSAFDLDPRQGDPNAIARRGSASQGPRRAGPSIIEDSLIQGRSLRDQIRRNRNLRRFQRPFRDGIGLDNLLQQGGLPGTFGLSPEAQSAFQRPLLFT